MNSDQISKDKKTRFRESDSASAPTRAMDSRRRLSDHQFRDREGHRFDQFEQDFNPTYEDEYDEMEDHGGEGEESSWSEDIRSVAARENHYGKGPRGYIRSDEKIYEDVCEMLTRSAKLDASMIEVKVIDGCVYLSGIVHTRADKKLAENLAEVVTGVRDIWNQLEIENLIGNRWVNERRGNQPNAPTKGLL